jgi:hypothetical protein
MVVGRRRDQKEPPRPYKDKLTPVENRVLATVEWVVRRYNIDRNRIYLTGISMGGSGTLGLGTPHGDIFAALQAAVPAGTDHAIYRLAHAKTAGQAGALKEIPPVLVFFSHKDGWSKGMEGWLDLIRHDELFVLAAWGPWGHINHYEMTDPAAYEFPWLSIRKNQAYPAFDNTFSDRKYPGFQSDTPDQSGQMNAYGRWNVLMDQPEGFAIELRLVQNRELDGAIDIPLEIISDITPRRLQRFAIKAGNRYGWRIEQAGRLISSGTVSADDRALVTFPRVKITAKPIVLYMGDW